jgi:predicted CopG family antitoxin
MTQAMTSIQIDIQTRQELKNLKGNRTYDELLLELIKIYKGQIERNRYRTPEKLKGMRRAIQNFVKNKVTFGKNGRIKEIDLSD